MHEWDINSILDIPVIHIIYLHTTFYNYYQKLNIIKLAHVSEQ